jgi:phosphoribosylformylglycinamidine synthase
LFKAKIKITLRRSILDPQGKAVEHAIQSLGYKDVKDTRIGKYIELLIDSEDRQKAEKAAEEICNKLLANPVMEDYEFELAEMEEHVTG